MKDILFERFETRLKDLSLKINRIDDDGKIHIECGENTLQISLDNVRKSYEQDGTFDHLDNLIASIHFYLMDIPIPTSGECYNKVFFSFFPSNHDYKDFLHEPTTDDFYKYYVYYDDNQFTWINKTILEDWGVEEKNFKEQVEYNMNLLLDDCEIEISKFDNGAILAYIETEIPELKSALLFTSNFKQKISPILGWPVYCVLPVRDFSYIFSKIDKEYFLDILGATVVKEYNDSGYAITKEIINISDEGIKAIGKYE